MTRLIVMVAVIALLSIGITFMSHLFSKGARVVKYLHSFAAILMASYFLLLSKTPAEGFQDIGRVLIAIMFVTWAAAGIICAVIIDARIKGSRK